ncbi:hypothetical protein DS62_09185, partial [Smithella sp. SC_K08D17]
RAALRTDRGAVPTISTSVPMLHRDTSAGGGYRHGQFPAIMPALFFTPERRFAMTKNHYDTVSQAGMTSLGENYKM